MSRTLKLSIAILLPGLIFLPAWPPLPVWPLLFIGFLPLFYIVKESRNSPWGLTLMRLYLALLGWNIALTWWVWNSTAAGAIVMLLVNSLFMCVPFMFYRGVLYRYGNLMGSLALIAAWMSFEFLHLNWDLSWPWLNLGNGLANATLFIQWYEFTGIAGGTLWILGMNLLIWEYWENRSKKILISGLSTLLKPIAFSLIVYLIGVPESRKATANVVCLQPSFDPWHEKFSRDPMDLLRETIQISEKYIDSSTDLLIWPETSLVEHIDIDDPQQNAQLARLRQLQAKYPCLEILSGADMMRVYRNSPQKPTSSARHTGQEGNWWDAYNSAVFLDKKGEMHYYHKSKLVPGTEMMPFTNYLPFIEKLAIGLDENSISGSLGTSPEPKTLGTDVKVVPAICYESIYGEYLGKAIANSGYQMYAASLICIITNDAWWGNTPGYKQHLAYAKLRAIESRLWIARSANTGTSCLIDPTGKIISPSNWWEKTAVKGTVKLGQYKTFYTRHGDYLYRLAVGMLIGLLIFLIYLRFTRIKN